MNIKQNWSEKFKTLLLGLIVFSIPINLFLKISLNSAYLNGFLVDYLIPKFYLVEIFLLSFIFLELFLLRKKVLTKFKKVLKEKNLIIFILLIVFVLRQFFSNNPPAAFNHLLHISEAILLFCFLKIDPFFSEKKTQKNIIKMLLVTIIFQSLIAYYQFIFQKSLLPYYFLGESNLLNFANISRGYFFNQEKILAYASTAHPNILAGIITIFSIIILEKKKNWNLGKILILGNALIIIYLSQSGSAFLTIILYQIYKINKNYLHKEKVLILFYYLFLLLLPYLLTKIQVNFLTEDSINRRNYLNKAAFDIFKNNQIFGVGINNFTTVLEDFSQSREVVRFIQPVHHLALIILSEGGLVLAALLFSIKEKVASPSFWQKGLILLAIASLDHYLLSQIAGLNLLAIFFFLI